MRYIEIDSIIEQIKAEHCERCTNHRCALCDIDEVLLLLEEADDADVEETKWVDVDERLPDKSGKYIVCNRSGAVYQTKFYTYPENKGGHWGQKDKGKNIIAWMPMPEVCLPFSLPKERKEK